MSDTDTPYDFVESSDNEDELRYPITENIDWWTEDKITIIHGPGDQTSMTHEEWSRMRGEDDAYPEQQDAPPVFERVINWLRGVLR